MLHQVFFFKNRNINGTLVELPVGDQFRQIFRFHPLGGQSIQNVLRPLRNITIAQHADHQRLQSLGQTVLPNFTPDHFHLGVRFFHGMVMQGLFQFGKRRFNTALPPILPH